MSLGVSARADAPVTVARALAAATAQSEMAVDVPSLAAARAAHAEAKKALAHAENMEALGKMPKRLVASIRKREARARDALQAAIKEQMQFVFGSAIQAS